MLSVVRLAPARGVIVEVKALEDWTKIVMRAPTIIKYLVGHPSPQIGISALITFSITLFTVVPKRELRILTMPMRQLQGMQREMARGIMPMRQLQSMQREMVRIPQVWVNNMNCASCQQIINKVVFTEMDRMLCSP